MHKFLIFLLFLNLNGCQKFGRKLLGVEERIKQLPPINAYVVYGDVLSDRFIVTEPNWENASSIIVKLCTGAIPDVCIGLPYYQNLTNPPVNVTYIQDRTMITIYNAKTGLPRLSKFRIEYIKENSECSIH